MSADRSASVLARLLNRSRSTGENYNLLLSRFAIERLLYRLSVSQHAGSFVLKGALLFALWFDTPHRPTKDVDLLGFGADDTDTLRGTFTAICAIDADDGIRYETAGMRIVPMNAGMVRRSPPYTLSSRIGLTGRFFARASASGRDELPTPTGSSQPGWRQVERQFPTTAACLQPRPLPAV